MSLKQIALGMIVMAILGTASFGYAKTATDKKSAEYDKNIILSGVTEYISRYASLPVEPTMVDSQDIGVNLIVEELRKTMTDAEIEAKYALVDTHALIQNKALAGTLKEGSTIVILRDDPSFIVSLDQLDSPVASYFYPLAVSWEVIPDAGTIKSVTVDMDKVYIAGDAVVEYSVNGSSYVTISSDDSKYYYDGKILKSNGSIE